MTLDHLSPLSGSFIRQIQDLCRTDRKNLLQRIRDGAHSGVDEDTILILIDGTTAQLKRTLEPRVLFFLDQIYLRSLNRTIGEISLLTPGIPAYITQADRDLIKEEVGYTMSLVAALLVTRNESISKTVFDNTKGVSGRINDASNEITRRWIPEMEQAIRIGMMHAWNIAAWSRIKEYSSGKRWVSGPVSDNPDHPDLNGMVIPVNDTFKVPEFHPDGNKRRKPVPACEMMFPGDITLSPDPQHLAGCWCRIEAAMLHE